MRKLIWVMVAESDSAIAISVHTSYAEANEAAKALLEHTWSSAEDDNGNPLGEMPADYVEALDELQAMGFYEYHLDVTHHTVETDDLADV